MPQTQLQNRGYSMLQTISEATSSLTGKDFILELAKGVSTIMGMRF